MSVIFHGDFSGGWQPDADSVNAPPNALLRGDNLTLDELGALALRAGSAKISATPLADTDVHSLFTASISGTRYRYYGAGDDIYRNGSSIQSSVAGTITDDVAFGSYLGQVFAARSTTKIKDDGSTKRTWGIATPSGTPTVAAAGANSIVFASCDSTETTWTTEEGTASNVAGFDGTANGARQIIADASTFRGTTTRTLASATDFTDFTGGITANDEDIIELWIKVDDPLKLQALRLDIDCNNGEFETDLLSYTWNNLESQEITTFEEVLDHRYDVEGYDRRDVESRMEERTSIIQVSTFRPDINGWNLLQVKRGQFDNKLSTDGKYWNTAKAVRLTFWGPAQATVAFDRVRIIGGSNRQLDGAYQARVVFAYENTYYTGLSAPGTASAEITLRREGVTVTWNNPSDTQITHAWIYIMGGTLDRYYRATRKAVSAWGAGTDNTTITSGDVDLLIADLRLETDNAVPPSNIISIAGPHYDRLFCLTSDGYLYPSRRRNPESYSAGQAIRVTGPDEVPYWVVKSTAVLAIGTSKDVYLLRGDGSEFPDGTVDFSLEPLGLGNPPIEKGVAFEGDTIIYFAADGWRVLAGRDSKPLAGQTSLLYRGQTRHGVSPVNVTGGRFRAAIAKGFLYAITPEGSSTTSSSTVYRLELGTGRWFRRSYTNPLRSIHREPDGTLITGDSSGFVWTLETGTQDAAADIAIVAWTKINDNGQPLNRKDAWDFQAKLDTGGATASIALHLDGSGTASGTPESASSSGIGIYQNAINTLAAFRTIQQRITGSFSTFRLYHTAIQYRERPALQEYAEPKPLIASRNRRRFSGLSILLDTLGAAATVTPVLDGTAQTAQTVTTSDPLTTALTFASLTGRDLWAKIAKATGFEFYSLEPLVIAELPAVTRGLHAEIDGGYPCEKVSNGVRILACTLGSARVFTIYLDGVAYSSTFTHTTGADEPDWLECHFATPQTFKRAAFSVDGNIELHEWHLSVMYRNPCSRQIWDTGPILDGNDLCWLYSVRLKAKLPTDLQVTPYLGGVAQAMKRITPTTDEMNRVVVYSSLTFPRGTKTTQLRFLLDIGDSQTFQPYWLQIEYRQSGGDTEHKRINAPILVA